MFIEGLIFALIIGYILKGNIKNLENVDVKAVYGNHFTKILPPQIIEQKRSGIVCRKFDIWRLKNFIVAE